MIVSPFKHKISVFFPSPPLVLQFADFLFLISYELLTNNDVHFCTFCVFRKWCKSFFISRVKLMIVIIFNMVVCYMRTILCPIEVAAGDMQEKEEDIDVICKPIISRAYHHQTWSFFLLLSYILKISAAQASKNL